MRSSSINHSWMWTLKIVTHKVSNWIAVFGESVPREWTPSQHNLLTLWSRVLVEKLINSQLVKNFPHFMEPKGSLPHSQVPVTSPYPEPHRSSHSLISHFLKIHLNIILPTMPGFSKWSLSLGFHHQNPVYTSSLPHTCYMPRPPHSSPFDHTNNTGWGVQIIKLLII